MDKVKVKKSELLSRITKNRNEHRALFEKALEGFRLMVIEELEKNIALAKANRKIVTHISLIEPQDHTKDYDRIIDMLDCSVDEVIELDYADFAAYMRDEWSWKEQFSLSNSAYWARSK